MENQLERKKILHAMYNAVHVLLIAHQKPDGDTVGSVLAIGHFLDSLNKRNKIFCKDHVSSDLSFLPGIDKLENDYSVFTNERFDLVIVCDCSDLEYAGVFDEIKSIQYPTIIVNIDHHRTNNYYGDLNLIMPNAPSTTQILHDFFHKSDITVTRDMATCLLTGIVTDTGGFSNPATDFVSLDSASKLLAKGAILHKITDNVERNKPIPVLKLWGSILSKIIYNEKYSIATAIITKKDLEIFGVSEESALGIANFMNNISGVRVALVLRESENNIIRGSFRTTRDDVDVSLLAKCFGGGGHKKAAGFSVEGRLVEKAGEWEIV